MIFTHGTAAMSWFLHRDGFKLVGKTSSLTSRITAAKFALDFRKVNTHNSTQPLNRCKPSMPIKILGVGIFNVKHRRVECPIYFHPPTQVVWEDLTVDDGCHYYSLHSNDKMLHKHTCFYNICICLMTSKIIYINIYIEVALCITGMALVYICRAPCQKKSVVIVCSQN